MTRSKESRLLYRLPFSWSCSLDATLACSSCPFACLLCFVLCALGGGGKPTMMASTSSHHALPAALDKLLADLAASSTSNPHSLTQLPSFLDRYEYGDFFDSIGRGKDVVEMGDERRWQVRLQLLTAIGKCPTVLSIQLLPLYQIGEEREEEVEALLGGLAASNTVLEELTVSKGLVSEASCRGPLGSLLRNNTRTLRTLWLDDADVDAAGLGHLVQALLANPDRVALRKLGLSGNKVGDAAGAAHVAALLQDNALPGLNYLDIRMIGLDMEGAHLMARALATNSTLEKLVLGGGDKSEAVALVLQLGLGEIPNHDSPHSSNRSIKTVIIIAGDHICLNGLMAAMRTNNVLEKVYLMELVLLDNDEHASSITAWLENSESAMLHLHLLCMEAPKSVKLAIFMALRSNRTLEYFTMSGWTDLDDELFGCLMDTLQINTTLRTISMFGSSWQEEGKDAFVRQALRRNAGRVAYLPSLAGLNFVDCNMARLFLCGPPAAGKTTLRKSMIHCEQKKWIRFFLERKRTKAIEVELLGNDKNMQVTIWDLAGQDEYRILHDHLFPDVRQACIFLFVFNPLDGEKSTLKAHVEEEFRNDLMYWMRFVASNGRSGGDNVCVQLLVIITHLDKMGKASSKRDILHWAEQIVDDLEREFESLVNICKPIFVIDAGKSVDAKPIVSKVFKELTSICSEKLPLVPEVCTKMSEAIAKWVLENPSKPFMSQESFNHLCELELLKCKVDFDLHQIIDAISCYLHDVGSILYFKDIGLRVVNMNWVTHVFLGSLIQSEKPMLSATEKGFMTARQLEDALNVKFVRNENSFMGIRKKQKYLVHDVKDLKQIMLRLELCYEDSFNGQQGFFIPTTIYHKGAPGLVGSRQLEWKLEDQEGIKFDFVGYRLQCQDQRRTLLTPAFFPRFQVHLRNDLFSKESLKNIRYENGCNLISILHNGMEILIECSGGGHIGEYVDILVKSMKSRSDTYEFIYENVLKKMQDFCASSKGCPGVALVEGIINPFCVKHLTLCARRKNQVVLKIDLRAKLLYEKLLDCPQAYFTYSNALDYIQHWDPIVGENPIHMRYHKVEELMDAKELRHIVNRNREFFESRRAKVEEVASMLMPASSNYPVRRPPKALQRAVSDLSDNTHGQFKYEVMGALAEIKESHKQTLEAVRAAEKNILSSQQQTLTTLESMMDAILGMPLQFQQSRMSMPKRPFISTDATSFTNRFLAKIYVGKAVRLHLMCENKVRNHIVEGQPGYSMTVEKSNCHWIRQISVNGAKLLFFLAKVGLHVAAGLGNAIPDFAEWGSAGPVTVVALAADSITQLPDQTTVGDANVEDVWVQLKQLLWPLIKDRMVELFNLYEEHRDGRVAWLCKDCMGKYSGGHPI